MPNDTSYGEDLFDFEFHGDLIPDELATTNDSGAVTVNVGLSGNKAGRASILRLNPGPQDNGMAEVDLGALYFQGQDGHIWFEARVSMLDVSVSAMTMGFNDETTDGGNTLPIELSSTTFTSTASTFAGFVYDADATNDNWHIFWVDDDSDTSEAIANLNSGIATADTTWATLRVDLFDRGSGNQMGALFTVRQGSSEFQYDTRVALGKGSSSGTIDRDVAMVPHIGVEGRSTAVVGLDIDYMRGGKGRNA